SRVFAMRQALRARGGMFGYLGARPADSRQNVRQGARERRARSSSGQRVPGGALIVFWTEWQSLKRGRGGVPLQLAVVAAAGVVGVLVGLAAAKGLAAGGIIAANVVLLLVVWSWALSVQLGRDLGCGPAKPGAAGGAAVAAGGDDPGRADRIRDLADRGQRTGVRARGTAMNLHAARSLATSLPEDFAAQPPRHPAEPAAGGPTQRRT